jgi:hypothetical protein
MMFIDIDHQEKFNEFAMKAGITDQEKDWQAALFILSSHLLARRCAKYVNRREIGFTELMDEIKPWSSSEKALVKLAASLFNNYWKIDINDIFWSLDVENTALALEAIRIRFQ